MFIQVIQGKCSRPEELHRHLDRWTREIGPHADGWLGGTYGFTDDGLFVGVVRFTSRDTARANSERPDQQQWWREAEQLFDGAVEFHDSDRVVMMLEGGSDEAGFVQVLRGKIDDPALIEAEVEEMSNLLHEARPEIIGSTLAIEEDGTFTETVAFTDESAAREGEQKAMPLTEQTRHLMEDWQRATHDVTYFDLHQPWFASRGAAGGR